MQSNPNIFYKYRAFNARSISMLANNQLYFASPLEFNDPFDCAAQEHTFENFNDKLAEFAISHLNVAPDAITDENTKELLSAIKAHPEVIAIQKVSQGKLSAFLKDSGILSLTTCCKSILMWSHYADYHKGFCVGFKNYLGLDKNLIRPIKYIDNRFNDVVSQYIDTKDMTDKEKEKKIEEYIIFSKYVDWRYEEEWRVVGKKGLVIYSIDCLDGVIFGAKMPIEDRRTILYLLQNKGIAFFEAVKSKNNFAIEIIPLRQ